MKKPSNQAVALVEEKPEEFLSVRGPAGWWAWAILGYNSALGVQSGTRWNCLASKDRWFYAQSIGKVLSEAHLSALRYATDKASAVAREYAVAEGREGTLEGKIEALAARVEELAALVEEGNSHGG